MRRGRAKQQITGKIGEEPAGSGGDSAANPYLAAGPPPDARVRSAEGSQRRANTEFDGTQNTGLSPSSFGQPTAQYGRRARTVEHSDRDRARQQEALRYQEEIKQQIAEREEKKRLEKVRKKQEDEAWERRLLEEQRIINEREQADIDREQQAKRDAEEMALMGPAARRKKQQQQAAGGGDNDGPKFGRRANTNSPQHQGAPEGKHDPNAVGASADEKRTQFEMHQAELQQQIEEKKRRKAEEAEKDRQEQAKFDARMEKWASSDVPLGAGPQGQQGQGNNAGGGPSNAPPPPMNPEAINNQGQQPQDVPSFLQNEPSPGVPQQQQPPPIGVPAYAGGAGLPPDSARTDFSLHSNMMGGPSPGFGGGVPPMGGMGGPMGGGAQPMPGYYPQGGQQPYLQQQPGAQNPYATGDVSMLRDEILTLLMDQRREINNLTQMQPAGGGMTQHYVQHQGPIHVPPAHIAQPPPSYRNFPMGGGLGAQQTQVIGPGGPMGPVLHASAPQTDSNELLDRFLQEDRDRDTRNNHGSHDLSVASGAPSPARSVGRGDGGLMTSVQTLNGEQEYVGIGAGADEDEHGPSLELSEEPTQYITLPPPKFK